MSTYADFLDHISRALRRGKRRGDWMATATGHQYWPLDPRPEDVFIEDIAHHLAVQSRYWGACRGHISIAQHAYYVSLAVPEEDAKWGLHHDSAEAYLGDMIRPIKRGSPIFSWFYRRAEARNMRAICDALDLPREEPASIERADIAVLLAEKRDRLAPSPAPWGLGQGGHLSVEPYGERIVPWPHSHACRMFLRRHAELFGTPWLASYEERVEELRQAEETAILVGAIENMSLVR